MQLTMTGEYAIRAMICLASKPAGTVMQIYDISREWDIPESFLRKIVQLLSKAGFINSHRGVRGGIELAKPAESISLLDVIEAIEGKLFLNKCLVRPQTCRRDRWCAVHLVWHEAQQKMKETLGSRSLASLATLTAVRYQELHPQEPQVAVYQ